MSLPAGTILQSRYRILRKLGQGGMGAVYEAFDLHVSAIVALKETCNSENISLQAFRKEAKLLANLHHESLPLVMDCFYENGGWFFVMEYVEGNDIEKSLEEKKSPFAVEDVLHWADQILDALEYLHENGIIHLDIKPSNLKLTNRRKIKLLDFGISKGAIGEITTLQNSYGVYGATRRYAPLEQLLLVYPDSRHMLEVNFKNRIEAFGKVVDQRSDLFALAMTLYQLLAGRCPEMADLRAMSIWSGKGDNLKPITKICPHVPKQIEAVLTVALALEPHRRFPTAADMREQLNVAKKMIEKEKQRQTVTGNLAFQNISLSDFQFQAPNQPPQQGYPADVSLELKVLNDFWKKEREKRERTGKARPPKIVNVDKRRILEQQDQLRAEQREQIESNEKKRKKILTLISASTVLLFGLLFAMIASVPSSSAGFENEPANINKNLGNVGETLKNTNKIVKTKRRK